jgi:Nitronate monooxygenase
MMSTRSEADIDAKELTNRTNKDPKLEEQSMADFIFFLTYHDRTIPTADRVLASVKDLGVKNIGFKDVGIPFDRLEKLKADIDAAGLTSYIELVSEDAESIRRSAQSAIDLQVDYLIGGYGEYAADVLDIVKGSKTKFYPYIGQVSGIPGVLRGTIADIVADARCKQDMGVDGLDLLAYRYAEGDPEELLDAVVQAVEIPVIAAGSVGTPERIQRVLAAGAAGFTIGTAIFDCRVVPGGSMEDQVHAVLAAASQ